MYVQTSRLRHWVEIDGPHDGVPLVFSNSLGASTAMWRPQVEAFASKYRVVRYDQRGHGKSDVIVDAYGFEALVDDALALRTLMNGLHTRYSRPVVEQAAIAGALNPSVLSEPGRAAEAAAYVATRLDMISEETERGWQGRANPSNDGSGGLVFERTVRGVKEVVVLDAALIGSADARAIDRYAPRLREVYGKRPVLRRRETAEPVSGPTALLDAIFAAGRKGLTMQRYKGLGEMNAEQLWETTLDPNVRSLLQVKVTDATDADSLFARLMGDEVEPRRDFIQENALSVANLDI